MHEATDFWTWATWAWLMAWAPTIWYVTALVTLWFGSGVFVFRSLLRTSHSSGRQRIASDAPQEINPVSPGADRVLWTFSSMWVLILAAILGPLLSPLFAFVYVRFIAPRVERDRR